MISQKKKYNEIVIVRVLSMAMIVLCHIIGFYHFIPGAQPLSNFFSVGVYVFLLVSGFLYGKKGNVPFCKFMVQRLKRIYLPLFIVVVVTIFVNIIAFSERYSFATIGGYLLNLQGLLFISWDLISPVVQEITNLGPLWFATIIMLCYCMLPLLQRIRSKLNQFQWIIWLAGFAIALGLQWLFNLNFTYFFVFYLGFLIGSTSQEERNGFNTLSIYVSLVALQLLRLYLMSTVDGTQMYLTFVSLSNTALGLLIFMAFRDLNRAMPKIFEKLANCSAIKIMDKMSFHVYLVHGIFCVGATNIYDKVSNIWAATGLFFAAVLAATAVLYYLEQYLLRLIDRK